MVSADMETHEIRYFLATARELNFTRAAAACNVTQPALTRAIKKLETELGGALFLRRPGRIELTRLARTVLPQLEAIERSMAQVRDEAQSIADQQFKSLRLGVMCTLGPSHIVEMLSELRSAVPGLEVSVTEAKAGSVVELLITDEIDVGITAWPHVPESIAVQPLYDERYAVAMSAQHPLATMPAIPLASLAGQPYLERLNCEFDDFFEARIGPWTIETEVCFSSEREDWIQAMIVAGLGCAILPELMLLHPGVVLRPLVEPEISRQVGVVSLRGPPLSEPALQFLRIARGRKWERAG